MSAPIQYIDTESVTLYAVYPRETAGVYWAMHGRTVCILHAFDMLFFLCSSHCMTLGHWYWVGAVRSWVIEGATTTIIIILLWFAVHSAEYFLQRLFLSLVNYFLSEVMCMHVTCWAFCLFFFIYNVNGKASIFWSLRHLLMHTMHWSVRNHPLLAL